jgi:hypothetical protein
LASFQLALGNVLDVRIATGWRTSVPPFGAQRTVKNGPEKRLIRNTFSPAGLGVNIHRQVVQSDQKFK